jgi:heme oxygenase (biliverdin-producing, ferredoxin)
MSLKELTWEKHKIAERSAFAKLLISGKISTSDYVNYLVQMGAIYRAIESKARSMRLLDNLEDLCRFIKIEQDIIELVGEDHGIQYLTETMEYVDFIDSLTDPKSVLANIYVRHMGDLYGGQMIAKKVPGSGRFYQFKNKGKLIEEIRKFADDNLAYDANIAFDYNIKIMKALINE